MHALFLLLLLYWVNYVTCLDEYRSFDGAGNNLDSPMWGVKGQPYLRRRSHKPQYKSDGNGMRSGLPNPRNISNVLNKLNVKRMNPRVLNDAHTAWALFIANDMLMTSESTAERETIKVPACDPSFDPQCTDNISLPFFRSAFTVVDGSRQQINNVSSYLDGSMIYGTDSTRAAALRSYIDGKLLMNDAGEVPVNTAGIFQANPVRRKGSEMRMTGDPRGNLSPQLLAYHSLFVREHNRYCDILKANNLTWNDETLYQEARRRVIAHIQHITFKEYLPALLGATMPLYAGYNSTTDPTIDNFFATVGFRFSHSEVNGVVMRLTKDWVASPRGHLLLRQAYYNPALALADGIEPILRGMMFNAQWRVETQIEDDLRNHLNENDRSSPPTDLMAISIQRGRDHGQHCYNAMRKLFGLLPVTWKNLTKDTALAAALQQLYSNVDDVEAIIGSLAEDPKASVGELLRASIRDQFLRLRSGDRFWFQNGQFSDEELQTIQSTSLRDIINRNTNLNYPYVLIFYRHDVQPDGGLFHDNLEPTTALGDQYNRTLTLMNKFRLHWSVDYNLSMVHFAAEVIASGYVGIGFVPRSERRPPGSAMYHVDMIMGRLVNGTGQVDDTFSFELGSPSLDTALNCTDDLKFKSFEVNGTTRIMRFSRAFSTVDSTIARGRLLDGEDVVKKSQTVFCDVELVPGEEYDVIYAFHPTQESNSYHGPARGVGSALLIPIIPTVIPTPQITPFPVGPVVGGICGGMAVILVLVGIFVWRSHSELRVMRKKLSDDNIAEECAQAIAIFDLDSISWLQTLEKPNRIQKSFIRIMFLLTEVKPFIPDQLLCTLTAKPLAEEEEEEEPNSPCSNPHLDINVPSPTHDSPDGFSDENSSFMVRSPGSHHTSQFAKSLTSGQLSPRASDKHSRSSVVSGSLRSPRPRLGVVSPRAHARNMRGSVSHITSMIANSDWVRRRCVYLSAHFGVYGAALDEQTMLGIFGKIAMQLVTIGKNKQATVDKVGFDLVQLHWGAIVATSSAALKATHAAMLMIQVDTGMPPGFRGTFWMRIGIGAGLSTVATLSASGHRFFVLGGKGVSDAVSASTTPIHSYLGSAVLVTPAVYQEVQYAFQCFPRVWHGDTLLWEPMKARKKGSLADEWMYEIQDMEVGEAEQFTGQAMQNVFVMAKSGVSQETLQKSVNDLKARYLTDMSPKDLTCLNQLLLLPKDDNNCSLPLRDV